MTYENMTPLGPDNKYTQYLKKEFGLTDANIVHAAMGVVPCFRMGKPETVKMLVIEVKGKGTEDVYHMHEGLRQKFFKGSGTLVNVQWYERANRNGVEAAQSAPAAAPVSVRATQPHPAMREDEPEYSLEPALA
ncbi:MAG TPA: hypothetical protein PLO23_02895 [Alphaproteobacteria bacterium]|nr:hypothetical protein [Alphaproteobacteria bacterium]